MKFRIRRELKKTKIEIIPMIDTMFFLLVFFMLSSLSMTHVRGLKVHLPKTSTVPPDSSSKLTLTITQNLALQLNGRTIQKENLQTEIQNEINSQQSDLEATSFIINADSSVPHGFVIECIDDSRAKGITHFAIATTPKK